MSPEDEIPLPSEPVLSEDETIRQLRADLAWQYTDRLDKLRLKLVLCICALEKIRDQDYRGNLCSCSSLADQALKALDIKGTQ